MKIALIGTAYPYRGGLAAYNERLAEELGKEHDVTIHTFTVQYPNFLFPGKSQYSSGSAPENLNIERTVNSVNPLNWISIGNKIKREKPDLIIIKFWLPFMGPCFGTILRRIKKNKHTKVITIVDNMIPHESRIGDRIFTKYFVPPVDGFVAMSQSVLDDIEIFAKEKPKLLSPHPLFDNFGDPINKLEAQKKLGLDPEYKYLLFFGLIRKYKGLDLILKAMNDQRIKDAKIRLVVAGEYYTDKEEYQQIIKDLKLEEEVIQFDKFIPNDEVRDFFSACDLVVQPYKSATQSGVTQIAYHFSKPMIVTNVGGLSELCPDGKVGYVVEPNPKEISEAILKYYNDTDHDYMQDQIEEEKKKYSWDILVKNTIKLMNQVN